MMSRRRLVFIKTTTIATDSTESWSTVVTTQARSSDGRIGIYGSVKLYTAYIGVSRHRGTYKDVGKILIERRCVRVIWLALTHTPEAYLPPIPPSTFTQTTPQNELSRHPGKGYENTDFFIRQSSLKSSARLSNGTCGYSSTL